MSGGPMQHEGTEILGRKRKWGSSVRTKTPKAAVVLPTEDLGPMERWRKKFGIQRINDAGEIRTEVYQALEIQPRLLEGTMRKVAGQGGRHKYEHPLDLLAEAGALGDMATEEGRVLAKRRRRAAMLMRAAYTESKIESSTTVNWGTVGGGGYRDESLRQTDKEAKAEMLYRAMLRACGRNCELVRDVACGRVWPELNAVVLGKLVAGLDALALFLRKQVDEGEDA